MYAWLWRKLPGDRAGKAAGMVGLAAVALLLLLFVVFPWIELRLPWNDVTVNSPTFSVPAATSPSASTSPSALPAG